MNDNTFYFMIEDMTDEDKAYFQKLADFLGPLRKDLSGNLGVRLRPEMITIGRTEDYKLNPKDCILWFSDFDTGESHPIRMKEAFSKPFISKVENS